MKRRDLIKILTEMGLLASAPRRETRLVYEWSNETIPAVPRHNEINERLAKSIIKKLKDDSSN